MIIGMGEVGQALSLFLNMPGRDVEPDGEQADTIHIAYPWTPGFEEQVLIHADEHDASLVVVHSTVPVGTCDPHEWVHSPVRGRHPDLLYALEVTVKPFGGLWSLDAARDWPGVSQTFPEAATTEAGKLWELAQYGIQIRVCQAIYEWCAVNDLDPGIVYEQFALDYNRDYTQLDPRFIRPVLEYQEGPIGGHCVLPSMGFLDHPLTRFVENDL